MRVIHRLAEALVQPTRAAIMIIGRDDLRRLIAMGIRAATLRRRLLSFQL